MDPRIVLDIAAVVLPALVGLIAWNIRANIQTARELSELRAAVKYLTTNGIVKRLEEVDDKVETLARHCAAIHAVDPDLASKG